VLIPAAIAADEEAAVRPLSTVLALAAAAHLLLVAGEITLTHSTAHARLAVEEMTERTYAAHFRGGVVLVLAALAAPFCPPAVAALAALAALAGLLAHEHAYVQAGQAVPLA
jgi:hypothetical protein